MLSIISQGSTTRYKKTLYIFPTRVNKARKHQISLKAVHQQHANTKNQSQFQIVKVNHRQTAIELFTANYL